MLPTTVTWARMTHTKRNRCHLMSGTRISCWVDYCEARRLGKKNSAVLCEFHTSLLHFSRGGFMLPFFWLGKSYFGVILFKGQVVMLGLCFGVDRCLGAPKLSVSVFGAFIDIIVSYFLQVLCWSPSKRWNHPNCGVVCDPLCFHTVEHTAT